MGWPKGKPRPKKAASEPVDVPVDIVDDVPKGAFTLEMEEAPDDTFPEPEQPNVLKNILGQLGLSGGNEDSGAVKKQPATKLNARQKQFCETFTPLATGVLVLSLTWGYSRFDEVYRVLAPSQEVATNIVAPLIRIYARQAKFVTSINPNYIDATASLVALVGYVHVTFQMYQAIKSGAWDEEQEEETNAEQRNPVNLTDEREGRYSGASHRRESVPVAAVSPVHAVPGKLGHNAHNDPGHDLTDAQRYQFEKLSKLRERDFASRARRSGRYGSVRDNVS